MLDKTLAGEIRSLAGSSRDEKSRAMKLLDEAAKDVAANGRYRMDDCLRRNGRAAVAVCIAETLFLRNMRLDRWGLDWAMDVLGLLDGWTPGNKHRAYIDDAQNHPTAVIGYAGPLVRMWSE